MSDILLLPEAAAYLRVPASTLRFWRLNRTAGPRSFKVGRRVAYRRPDLDAWLAQQLAEDSAGYGGPGVAR